MRVIITLLFFYRASVSENESINAVVETVSATDDDHSSTNNVVTYTITSKDILKISIHVTKLSQ